MTKRFDDIQLHLAELMDEVEEVEEAQQQHEFDGFLVGYSIGYVDGLFEDNPESDDVYTQDATKTIITETVSVIAEEVARHALRGYLDGSYTLDEACAVSGIAEALTVVRNKFGA